MSAFWDWLIKIISNPSACATIIAALIGGCVAIFVAVYNKRVKSSNLEIPKEQTLKESIVPPPPDPLSKLKTDPCNLNDIDEMKFGSRQYIETLVTRMEMKKNPNSQIEAYIMEENPNEE